MFGCVPWKCLLDSLAQWDAVVIPGIITFLFVRALAFNIFSKTKLCLVKGI